MTEVTGTGPYTSSTTPLDCADSTPVCRLSSLPLLSTAAPFSPRRSPFLSRSTLVAQPSSLSPHSHPSFRLPASFLASRIQICPNPTVFLSRTTQPAYLSPQPNISQPPESHGHPPLQRPSLPRVPRTHRQKYLSTEAVPPWQRSSDQSPRRVGLVLAARRPCTLLTSCSKPTAVGRRRPLSPGTPSLVNRRRSCSGLGVLGEVICTARRSK